MTVGRKYRYTGVPLSEWVGDIGLLYPLRAGRQTLLHRCPDLLDIPVQVQVVLLGDLHRAVPKLQTMGVVTPERSAR